MDKYEKDKQTWKEVDQIQDLSTHARDFMDEFSNVQLDENSTDEERNAAYDEMVKRMDDATDKMDDYIKNHSEDSEDSEVKS